MGKVKEKACSEPRCSGGNLADGQERVWLENKGRIGKKETLRELDTVSPFLYPETNSNSAPTFEHFHSK